MKVTTWIRNLALAVPAAAASGYAAWRAGEEPETSPRRFLAKQMRRPGHTVVACLGASLVQGRIGASFVEALAQRFGRDGVQFVNAGRNGDLAYNALLRVEDVIACEPDVVIVLVGSNDLMAALGTRRSLGYRLFKRLPVKPTLEWYRENLTAIGTTLRARTNARIAFCSLPSLGERVHEHINDRLHAYNAVVREVAAGVGAAYIPVEETLDAWLEQTGHDSGPSFHAAMTRMAVAVVQHYLFGRTWDAIASAHGYALFVDGIHVNDRGASMIADEVERYLRQEAAQATAR